MTTILQSFFAGLQFAMLIVFIKDGNEFGVCWSVAFFVLAILFLILSLTNKKELK